MIKNKFFLLLLLYVTFMSSVPVLAFTNDDLAELQPIKDKTQTDERVLKLEAYLIHKKSPFALYAQDIVDAVDKYGLPDWKLIPAISGVESNFGRFIPAGSYNAVGWVNGNYNFKSWPDMFDTVGKTLKEKYYGRGLDTVEKIAPVYAPPSVTWAGKVNFFMKDIDGFVYEQPSVLPEFTL